MQCELTYLSAALGEEDGVLHDEVEALERLLLAISSQFQGGRSAGDDRRFVLKRREEVSQVIGIGSISVFSLTTFDCRRPVLTWERNASLWQTNDMSWRIYGTINLDENE